MDVSSILIIFALVIIVFLAIDLLMAGGSMTGGMMQGMAGMMGTPLGWVALLLIAVVIALLLGVGR